MKVTIFGQTVEISEEKAREVLEKVLSESIAYSLDNATSDEMVDVMNGLAFGVFSEEDDALLDEACEEYYTMEVLDDLAA